MLEGNGSLGSRAGVTGVAPRDGLKSSFVVRRRIGGRCWQRPGAASSSPPNWSRLLISSRKDAI